MLSTKDLESYVRQEIQGRIDDVSWNGIYFKHGKENDIEGTYIFYDKGKYHIDINQKGTIEKSIITEKKEEILLQVLDIVSFPIAMDYAIKSYDKKRDYRRKLFEKEIEIFGLFGEEIKARKIKYINDILTKNPYND